MFTYTWKEKLIYLFFACSSLISVSFGDVHTAFDVKIDIALGGCAPDEVTKIELAFTETMEMASLIQNAVTSMQAGTEENRVGWMFSILFGIQSSEELFAHGIQRPEVQTKALAKIGNLMSKILDHGSGTFRVLNAFDTVTQTRLFCNKGWAVGTNRRMDQQTRTPSFPFVLLGGQHWWDSELDFYLPVTTLTLSDPDLLMCGAKNAGFTSREVNAITICNEIAFDRPTRIADINAPVPDANPPALIDNFNSVSMTFLHEYAHLIGRGSIGTLDNPIANVALSPEFYQWVEAAPLVARRGMDAALGNADSYALLGVALKLKTCDWRNGECHSLDYYPSLRRQAAAEALLQLAGSGP